MSQAPTHDNPCKYVKTRELAKERDGVPKCTSLLVLTHGERSRKTETPARIALDGFSLLSAFLLQVE